MQRNVMIKKTHKSDLQSYRDIDVITSLVTLTSHVTTRVTNLLILRSRDLERVTSLSTIQTPI